MPSIVSSVISAIVSYTVSAVIWTLVLEVLHAAQEVQLDPKKKADLVVYFLGLRWTWVSGTEIWPDLLVPVRADSIAGSDLDDRSPLASASILGSGLWGSWRTSS